jgi:hypothetical protein
MNDDSKKAKETVSPENVENVKSMVMDDIAKPNVPLSIDKIQGSRKLEGEDTKTYYARRKAEARATKMYLRGRVKPHPGTINSRG